MRQNPEFPLPGEEWSYFTYHPELPREELISKTNAVLTEYAKRSVDVLYRMVRRGEGRDVLGSVSGRPEDEQLQIDAAGEHILSNLVRDYKLPCLVLGEHNNYYYANTTKGRTYVILPIDSFDNTSQYKRDLDTSVYTVAGAYHQDGEPIGAVVGDIKDRKVYLAVGGETFLRDLDTGETKKINRSERTSIRDDNFTLATYLGSNEYSLNFFRYFGKLVEDMPPKAVLYGGGGAYIYGLLASGAVDTYVMFDEPRTEIDPGLPLALAAGCTVVSVNPDGSFEDYKFNPNRHKEGRVPLFIAAATPELRDEIIRYYVEAQQQMRENLVSQKNDTPR